MVNNKMHKKLEFLRKYTESCGKLAVAFSGGIDSTFLLSVAHEVLGKNAVAVNVKSNFVPERESEFSRRFCTEKNIELITFEADEDRIPDFKENPKNRCYFCKKYLFQNIIESAKALGIEKVAEGSNADDDSDFRPGHKAIDELKVLSPLREAGLTKSEIRELSREMGIEIWNKPSAACLASRIPYGEIISSHKLELIEKGEQLLYEKKFSQFRIRLHETQDKRFLARIEILPKDFEKIMDEKNRTEIYSELKKLGFTFVSLDLGGFKSGGLNI